MAHTSQIADLRKIGNDTINGQLQTIVESVERIKSIQGRVHNGL